MKVGRHCAISALTGISGSAVLGDGVTVGGQVGFTDQYDAGVRELLRIDELAAARLLQDLEPALQRYRRVEPAALGAVDEQLRHSLLRPLAAILARLNADGL